MTEFELINRYFNRPAPSAVLGVGDDCALLAPSPGMQVAVSTDMLLEGRHFLPGTDARRLGHKSLAVNLSDLAAMGAAARWAFLAIALPAADEQWMAAFAEGLYALAGEHGVDLAGGDTTRGPLCIAITVLGEVPPGKALRRAGAGVGDDVWVSGMPGEAALGLAHLRGEVKLDAAAAAHCVARLEAPQPRLELGVRLRGLASGAIDISDGLLGDLGHVLKASGVGAQLQLALMPRSDALRAAPEALVERFQLAGGDDYELLFTAAPAHRAEIAALATGLGLPLTRIGAIVPGPPRARVLRADGREVDPGRGGFDHFASA
jgi:thiamine-monophosphate kinase